MRKLMTVILVISALSFVVYGMAFAAAAAAKNVTVMDVQGKAEVISEGSSTPAIFGMKLGAGDTIKTGANSYVDLNFNGGGQDALVRIDQNSDMKIAEYIASPQVENKKIALDLAMGDVLVKANHLKNESQFQVRTPTSVVGVRGTGFKVSVSAEK